MRTIVWFREQDLRVGDHEALSHAARGRELVAVFVLEPETFGPGAAARAPHRVEFLLEALDDLDHSLRRVGNRLLYCTGPSETALPSLVARLGADAVVTHRLSDPRNRQRERQVAEAIGRRLCCFGGQTLHDPGSLRTGSGQPFSVFTPFARAFRSQVTIGPSLPVPRQLPPVPAEVAQIAAHTFVELPTLTHLDVSPNPELLRGGERRARSRLRAFTSAALSRFASARDRMDTDGTSRLSADLAFGTLSPRRIWTDVRDASGPSPALERFQDQLLWREFAHSTLWDRPELLRTPFRTEFQGFPWRENASELLAWKQGFTGYPLVDAAARQLLSEGFVHNRARMVAAGFLCKQLLIDPREGERHYLAWLVDADVAQNDLGWQWCAGSGCSAQPFFRVMNPVIQGRKFDPRGHYVRRWVPELSRLPERYIHEPWSAPPEELRAAGVTLGVSYPKPIVDHREARQRALDTARRHFRDGYVAALTPDSTTVRSARPNRSATSDR